MKKNRKLIRLVHNPNAGEGAYSKNEMISMIESHGYKCSYAPSDKKALKDIEPETEFIAIAGGDGTIRGIIMKLLDKKLKDKRPIALLPFGTANNIASALKINTDTTKNIETWDNYNLKKFDVGQVIGLQETSYFIESLGFGLFPKLMSVMDAIDTKEIEQNPEEKLRMALNELLKLTKTYRSTSCSIEIDGKEIKEECIMLEVMNISSLGPKLIMSKNADPGDGFFDVLIVTEAHREKLQQYITGKCEGKEPKFPVEPIRTKSLNIKWKGKDAHIDDEPINDYQSNTLKISLLDSLLEIVTNRKGS